MQVNNSSLTLSGSEVTANHAGVYGGGVGLENGATANISITTLSGNDAETGGGLRIGFESEVVLLSSSLSENTATSGGGLAVGHGGTAVLDRVELTDNIATSGGGLFVDNAEASGEGCVFTGNDPDDAWVADQPAAYTLDAAFSCDSTGCQ